MSPQEIWIFLILSLQNKTETEINLLPVFDRKNHGSGSGKENYKTFGSFS